MDNFGDYEIVPLPFGASYFGKDGWRIGDQTTPTSFTKKECVPTAQGGHPVTRDLMNKVGYLATIGPYLDSIGYPYGNQNPWGENGVATQSAGYPKGAIIRIYNDNTKCSYEFLSLVDDNTDDWPWRYYSAGLEVDDSIELNGHWKPLFTKKKYNFYPNYNDRTVVLDTSVSPGQTMIKTVTLEKPGWMYVTRTMKNWAEVAQYQFNADTTKPPLVEIGVRDQADSRVQDSINMYLWEGEIATRLLPFGATEISLRLTNVAKKPDYSVEYGSMNVRVEILGFEES